MPEFSERQIQPLPLGRAAEDARLVTRLVTRLIRADNGRVLIQLLEVEPMLRALLSRPAVATETLPVEVLPID